MTQKSMSRPLEHDAEMAELELCVALVEAGLLSQGASSDAVERLHQAALAAFPLSTPAQCQRATLASIARGLRAGILSAERVGGRA